MSFKCILKEINWRDDTFQTAIVEYKNISKFDDSDLRFYMDSRNEHPETYFIQGIKFNHCNIERIPQGLKTSFPYLKALAITNSNFEFISSDDMDEYKDFTHLIFKSNNIEFLPSNLFQGFEYLRVIDFSGNALNVVNHNILNGLDKLTYVNFSREQYHELCFSSKYFGNDGNASLEEIKDELREIYTCSADDSFYMQRAEIRRFKAEVERLKAEIEQYKADLQGRDKIKDLLNGQVKIFIQRDESFKDFRVKIDDREFLVHKLLLAARCPTIAEMLRQNPQAECLNLVDISVPIFEKILDYFYTDQLPLDEETNFLHLFAAAGQLKVEELKHHAAEKVCGRINAENQLEVLKLGNKYGHNGMVQQAFKEIKKKYPKMKFKDEWAKDSEKLAKIVESFVLKEQKIKKIEEEFTEILTE